MAAVDFEGVLRFWAAGESLSRFGAETPNCNSYSPLCVLRAGVIENGTWLDRVRQAWGRGEIGGRWDSSA